MATACTYITDAATTTLITVKDALYDLAQLVARFVTVACTWLKPSEGFENLVLKPLNIAYQVTVKYSIVVGQQLRGLFAAARIAKPLVDLTDAVSKIPGLFETRAYSTFRLADDGGASVSNLLEHGTKAVAQLSEWTISLYDLQEAATEFKLIELSPKWVAIATTVMRFALGFFALYTIAEEAAKLYNQGIVDQADGRLFNLGIEDYIHSILKIATAVACLGMAILGANLALQIAATALTIASHYCKQLFVSPDVHGFV